MQDVLRMYQSEHDSDGTTLYHEVSLVVLPPHRSVKDELDSRLGIATNLYDRGLAYYATDTYLECTHSNSKGTYSEIVEYLFSVPSGCSSGWILHKYREMNYCADGVKVVRG